MSMYEDNEGFSKNDNYLKRSQYYEIKIPVSCGHNYHIKQF